MDRYIILYYYVLTSLIKSKSIDLGRYLNTGNQRHQVIVKSQVAKTYIVSRVALRKIGKLAFCPISYLCAFLRAQQNQSINLL